MFGLGLMECALLSFLFVLLVGPRFLANSFQRIWGSFLGLTESFQEAKEDHRPSEFRVRVEKADPQD